MRMCRICLTNEDETGQIFASFFDDDCATVQKYIDLFGLEIIESDENPALICEECLKSLDDAAKLKECVLLADSFFRELFDGSKTVDEETIAEEYEPADEIGEEIVHEEEFFEVLEYDEIIETSAELAAVQISHHNSNNISSSDKSNKKTLQCHCGIIVSSAQRLRNHIRTKHDEIKESEMFACTLCDKRFKLREYLDLHTRNVHVEASKKKLNSKNVACKICGRILSSLVALRNHQQRHLTENQPESEVKIFCCDLCDSSFRLKSYLFNHINNKHLRQKYSCSYCEKRFYKKYECEDHVRQYHTFEKPFECEYEGCNKSFARKKNYAIHKRIHTGERPYACTIEGCNKSFMHFIDRKRHLMKHSGEKPFPCKVRGCRKEFRRKTELDSHTKATHSVIIT